MWHLHFYLKVGNTALKHSDNAMKRTQTWVVYSIQAWGNFAWSLWAFRSSLHRLHRWKHGKSLQNCQWRLTKYSFGDRWQVKPLIRDIPANSNRGLDHAANLRKVCALVAHRRVEAAACVCLPGTAAWSQKQSKLPLEESMTEKEKSGNFYAIIPQYCTLNQKTHMKVWTKQE